MKLLLPLALATAALTPNAYAQSCEATGNDLNVAKNAYSQMCPDIPRADCDPIGGGQWTCSSEVIGYAAPGRVQTNDTIEPQVSEPEINATQASTPQADEPSTELAADPAPEIELPETTSSECVASGSNLNLAVAAYDASCMAPRVDCDPIDGGWSCSSGVIGGAAPAQVIVTTPPVIEVETTAPAAPVVETPAPVPAPVVVVDPVAPSTGTYTGPAPQTSWKDSYSVNGVCYLDGGTDHNALGQLWTINGVTRTVGQWIPFLKTGPGRGNNHIYNDVQCGHGPANDAGDEDAYPVGCPGLIIPGSREGCNVKGPTWQLK